MKLLFEDIGAFAGQLNTCLAAMPQMLVVNEFQRSSPAQVVIAGKPGAADTHKMAVVVGRLFLINVIVILADPTGLPAELARDFTSLSGMKIQNGHTTACLCEKFVCRRPTTDSGELFKMLKNMK